MLVDAPVLSTNLTELVFLVVKIGFVLLAILYFIFSLIVIRQINLMTETVVTEAAAILRAFGILHAGLSLGIVVLLVSLL